MTGILYPLTLTLATQAVFSHEADGSLVEEGDQIVGSSLIGQSWEGDEWFYGRPSAVDYDASASGGSNLGPLSEELAGRFREAARSIAAIEAPYRGAVETVDIPVDLLTSSASGLDPHISLAAALFQSPRIAEVRNIALDRVEALIRDQVEGKTLGVWGQERVNVLELNLALADLART